MPRRILVLLIVSAVIVSTALLVSRSQKAAAASFTVEQIKSYPFPNELTASATGARIAWAFNERGSPQCLGCRRTRLQSTTIDKLRCRRWSGVNESLRLR